MTEIRRVEQNGIMYKIMKDDSTGITFAVAAYPIYRNMKELCIDAAVKDIPVTVIDSGAFAQLPNLKRVIVCSKETLYVGDAAFANCPNLTEVHFHGKLSVLDSEVFRECPELIEVWSFHTFQLSGRSIFKHCSQKISMVGEVIEVGNCAFLCAPEFKTLYVADNAKFHASSMVGFQADDISFAGNIELVGNASFDMFSQYKMICKKHSDLADLFHLGMDVVVR